VRRYLEVVDEELTELYDVSTPENTKESTETVGKYQVMN
jgi:hypothetical protein